MANLVLALGLFALVAQSQGFGMGGFPGIGGMMGGHAPMGGLGMGGGMGGFGGVGGGFGGGMGGGYGGGYHDRKEERHPEFLTCISKDDDDLTSQIRLTLTRNRHAKLRGGHPGGPMGGPPGFAADNFDDDDDDEAEFRVDGTFVPGMGATSKAGTYRVVITQFGRTADGCMAPSLGPVLQRLPSRNPHQGFGGMPGFGGMGGMHGMGGFRPPMSPMGQSFWHGGSGHMKRNVGEMHNAAIIGTSASVFSDHVTGISKNNLIGRGVALCRGVRDGMCLGRIPYCCTIGRDNLPAMEQAIQRGRGGHMGGDMDDYDGGMMLGVGGAGLSGVGGGAVGGGFNGGDDNSLF